MEIAGQENVSKTPETYCKDLMVTMNNYRTAVSLCDVKLVVEGVEFPAHRIVLASGSPFFHGLFTSEMKEKQENRVVLKEVNSSVMDNVLEYFYTGKTEVTVDNAENLLECASYFLLDDLKEAASSCISEDLKLENCLKVREFAEKYDCTSLEKSCREFIVSNFYKVIDKEEFFNLEVEQIEEFFSNEETLIFREEVMYEAIRKWVKKSPATRKKHFKTLFRHVRLQHISKQYINAVILKDTLVTGDVVCMQFVLQSMSNRDSLPLPLKPRECFDHHVDVIVISGGFDGNNSPTTSVMCFAVDGLQKKWRTLSPLSTARYGSSSTFCGGFLYCVGGWEAEHDSDGIDVPTSDMERFEPVTNSWLKMKPFNCAEKWVAAASIEGCLYVLGRSNTLYLYNPALDSWQSRHSFQGEIHGACLVADSSSLYMIGGLDENNTVTSACRNYNPEFSKLTSLTPMHVQRYLASAVLKKDQILIVGGLKDYESTHALGSCEMYSIKNDQWMMFPSLQHPRYSAGIACVWEEIYILGGEHEGETQSTVEHYKESKKAWEAVASMPGRSFFSCTWVRMPYCVLSSQDSILLPNETL